MGRQPADIRNQFILQIFPLLRLTQQLVSTVFNDQYAALNLGLVFGIVCIPSSHLVCLAYLPEERNIPLNSPLSALQFPFLPSRHSIRMAISGAPSR